MILSLLNSLSQNKTWLVPYAAFCYLKELNGTVDFHKWKTYGKYTKLAVDRLTSPQSRQYDQICFLLLCPISFIPPTEKIRSLRARKQGNYKRGYTHRCIPAQL